MLLPLELEFVTPLTWQCNFSLCRMLLLNLLNNSHNILAILFTYIIVCFESLI